MRREIFQYVRRCDFCQRAKPSQNTRVGLHSATPSSRPLGKAFVDFMGPMVRTKKGHQAILVILDGFSKFVVFYFVKSIMSKVVCEAFEWFYFLAYGVQETVVSDNAKVFKSKPYYDLCFKWGLKRIYPTPYYPQGSLVETVNRNLRAALKIYHHQSQTRWDEDLSLLRLALNSARYESTSFTPARLFLEREIRSPLEIN
jgi:hypothetical protein